MKTKPQKYTQEELKSFSKYPYDPTLPIFVYGTKLKGINGAGAARCSSDIYGADYGVGFGFTGQAFALPTKRSPEESLSLRMVESYVILFLEIAREHGLQYGTRFNLTKIGCGLAGFDQREIADMFRNAPTNVWLVNDLGDPVYPARDWYGKLRGELL